MAYTKTDWRIGTTPPINETNLDHLETQYDEAKIDIDNLAGVGRTTETVKGNSDALAAHEADNMAQDVGGTGTAITITLQSFDAYTDNYLLTFIAGADNGGAATTIDINGLGVKSVYKPNTISAPNFVAGKAYTVWYDATGGNFFGKASAEGTAVAGDVLANKTFSNDDDSGIVGTMPNNGALGTITPTTANQNIPAGYTSGGTVAGDADLLAGNILSGKDIFGVVGNVVAGAIVKSVQRGTTTGIAAATTNITIPTVDINNCIVLISYLVDSLNDSTARTVRGRLTTNTNLELYVYTADSTVTVRWEVVEFNNLKSLQMGTTTVGAVTTLDVAITSVDIGKSFVYFSRTTSDASIHSRLGSCELLDATTLRLYKSATTYDNFYQWYVVEFL